MVRGSNPGGGEIFRTCPDRPWGPTSLLYNGYRVFPGGKEKLGRDADPSPLLVPWSWKGRAIPLLPLWAVRPVQSLIACTRVTFTLPLPYRSCSGVYDHLCTKCVCTLFLVGYHHCVDHLCGLVVRVSGYRYRGLGFDSRRYQICWVIVGLERDPLSLVRSIEELLE
jgi:hypothetical protein